MSPFSTRNVAKARPPWDARLVGWAHVAFGILGLLLWTAVLTGFAQPGPSEWRSLYLFGMLEVRSVLWSGVIGVPLSAASVLEGYGLARGRRYGWWLALALNLNVLPTLWVNLTAPPRVAPIWLAFYLLVLGWLLWRVRLYRPFGSGPARNLGTRYE